MNSGATAKDGIADGAAYVNGSSYMYTTNTLDIRAGGTVSLWFKVPVQAAAGYALSYRQVDGSPVNGRLYIYPTFLTLFD